MGRRIVVAEFENVFGLLRSRGTNERCRKSRSDGSASQKIPTIERTRTIETGTIRTPTAESIHGHTPENYGMNTKQLP
jgi:hypothetical protein